MIESITFFGSYYDAISDLEPEEQGALYKAIMDYAFAGIEPELEGALRIAFKLIKPNIDASVKRHKAGKTNGSKGGRPTVKKQTKNQSKTNGFSEEKTNGFSETETHAETKSKPDKDKEKDKDKDIREKPPTEVLRDPHPRSQIPPTLEMVKAYCIERGNNVDPERFFDFYEGKGWMVGKNKMKDWQAAVRTWEKREDGTDAVKRTVRDLQDIGGSVQPEEYERMEVMFGG